MSIFPTSSVLLLGLIISVASEPEIQVVGGQTLAAWQKDLGSADQKVVHEALAKLGKLGPVAKPVVPSLLEVLQRDLGEKPLFALDTEAAALLGSMGPVAREAIPALLKRMKANTRSIDYALTAGNAIVRMGGPHLEVTRALAFEFNRATGRIALFDVDFPMQYPVETTKHLVQLLQDPDPRLRERICHILADYQQISLEGRWKPKELLARAGDVGKEIPSVMEQVLGDKVPAVALAAAKAIPVVAPERVEKILPAVINAMRAGEFRRTKCDQSGSVQAAMLAPIANQDKVFQAMLPLLDSPERYLRQEAIKVLARLAYERQIEALIQEGKTASHRSAATRVMALGDNHWIPILTTALGDKELAVRFASAVALTRLSRSNDVPAIALPALLEGLGFNDSVDRQEAIEMVRLAGPKAEAGTQALKKLTLDPDLETRIAAGLALVAVNPKQASDAIAPLTEGIGGGQYRYDLSPLMMALGDLGSMAKSAIPTLEKCYDLSLRVYAARAAEAVIRIDSAGAGPRALKVLTEIVAERGPNRNSRMAVQSLERLGPLASPVIPALEALLRDPKTEGFEIALAIIRIDADASGTAPAWVRAQLKKGSKDDNALSIAREVPKLGRSARVLLPEVVEMLKSPDEYFRSQAIRALLQIGPKSSVALPQLQELAQSDPKPFIRELAQRAIHNLGPK